MKDIQKNWLEWGVFGVSCILILGMLGYLGWDAVTAGATPPRIAIHLGEPQRSTAAGKEQFLVPVSVTNHGDQTAEGVQIEVTLAIPGREPEESGFEIQFLPRQSMREGGVIFSASPDKGQMKARMVGYEKP